MGVVREHPKKYVVSLATVQGPLILLHGFHPGLLQICSMHVLNIGLMFDLNGCGLMLCLICFSCQFNILPYASKGCFHLAYNRNLCLLAPMCSTNLYSKHVLKL